jgi:hypothetical protein
MMNEVAPETPNESSPSQMSTARPMPQRPAWTPRSMLGDRRCTRRGCYSLEPAGMRAKKKARGSASTPSGHFAEPISLSSAASASFRLPPTTAWCRFDLLALRARRKWESRRPLEGAQERAGRKTRYLRRVQFSTFPQPSLQLVRWSEARRRPGAVLRRRSGTAARGREFGRSPCARQMRRVSSRRSALRGGAGRART